MKFGVIDEGFVYRCRSEPEGIAGTPRCVVTDSGEVICSFPISSGLGVNDFRVCLARSSDGGRNWAFQGPVWPELCGHYSVSASISRSPAGELFLFGQRTPIGLPGESFWSEETLGILPNELLWSRSRDDGRTWSEPHVVPLPLPGAAEVPAPLCVTRAGRWLAPYAPHPTFDPQLEVDRGHIVLMISDDEGKSWRHTSMIRVPEPESVVAESWVVELSDGRLLGAAWHIRLGAGDDFPNVFALSDDGGDTWRPSQPTPITGQSVGLAPLPDGRVLMAYNQRKHDTPGVWLAQAQPTESDFGLEANQVIWRAEMPTQGTSSGKHEDWTDFAFGEPSVTVLPDGMLLATLWCIQPTGRGIPYVRLKVSE